MKNASLFFLLLFCVTIAQAQQEFQTHEDLKAWLPAELSGYIQDADNHSSEQQVQGSAYFIAAKQYKKATSVISVVIIDYRKSATAITAVTSVWEDGKAVENDVIQSRNITIDNHKVKEVYDKKNGSSQLYVYYKDRYLITLSAKGDNVNLLKQAATNLPFSRLP
ncbi:MAG: hypothetical protein O9262_03010 [Cyclobacteriaceae bacterium]|nr:hypothetical protein [Cyclobacteriaceae bacterium]